MVHSMLFLAIFMALTREAHDQSADEKCANEIWPVGDPKYCQNKLKVKSLATKLTLGVVPGSGWDNLQNTELGLVVDYIYSACHQTPDGKYLLPDNCNAQPKNTYAAQQSQETIETWLNSTTVNSRSVNLGLDVTLPGVATLSGSYSYEKTNLRSKMLMTNTMTVRSSVNVEKYDILLQPDAPLSPEFKKRIMSIADLYKKKSTELARYEAQLLVRDFGTHYINSMKVGAKIFKEDFIKRDAAIEIQKRSSTYGLEASGQVSFLKYNNLTVAASTNISEQNMNETQQIYNSSRTHSTITSHGGAISEMASENFTEWSNGIDENLVALDRGGSPLFYIITSTVLPELTASDVSGVQKLVRDAVQLYYQMNTVKGCTDVDSRNYNPFANMRDDSSCSANPDKYFMGGFYQTCEETGDVEQIRPCSGKEIKHSRTQAESCPPGFVAQLLVEDKIFFVSDGEITESCLLLFLCTSNVKFGAVATLKLIWCAGLNNSDGGVLFGGMFSKESNNPITDAKKCPVNYQAQAVLSGTFICLADQGLPRNSDIISAKNKKKDVPFGGLYTNVDCQSGNPFTGSKSSCPKGYISVPTNKVKNCTIYFCTKPSAIFPFQRLRRPPFMLPPPDFRQSEYGLIPRKAESEFNLSKKQTAILCALLSAATLLICAIMCFTIRKRKHRRYKREVTQVSLPPLPPKQELTQRKSSTSV